MAEFTAKLGLDSTDFVNGLNNAAKSTSQITNELQKVGSESQKIGGGFSSAGGAVDGLKTKVAGLGNELTGVGSIAKTALGVFSGAAITAGVQALGRGFSFIAERAREADDAADTLNISLVKAGLSASEAAKEQERLGEVAKKTANDFALPTNQVTALQAKIAGFGGVTGEQLDKLTEFSIGAASALDLPAEAVAKVIAKGADEEQQGKLAKLGIVFDKNATQAERFAIVQAKLGPVVDAAKASSQDSIGAFDRLKNTVEELAITIGSKLFDVLAPVFNSIGEGLAFIVPVFTEGFGLIVSTLTEAGAIIGDAFASVSEGAGSFDLAGAAITVFKGVIDGLVVVIRVVALAIAGIVNVFGLLTPALQTLSPLILGAAAAFGAYQAVTWLSTGASTAFASIQTFVAEKLTITAIKQQLLNFAMSANPIGLVVAAAAGLAAGLVVLYNKSETFRNLIRDLWEWVKKAAVAFIDFGTRFSPITGLFRLAYDNIKPFRDAVDALIGQVLKLWDGVKNLASSIGDLFSSGSETQEVKVEAKVETKADETKTAIETETAKNPPKVKVKVEKADTKDITEELRNQQNEIDNINRETAEASIKDATAREIRNLENQFADKIAKVRDSNREIQEADNISAVQKAQAQKLANDQILALEGDLIRRVEDLKEKQRQKELADAQKQADDIQKLRDEAEDEAEEARQTLAARKRQREAEEAKKAEEERRNIVQAFTSAIDNIRKESSENAVKAARNLDALNAEEKALTESLNRREISYEDFNVKIAELERRRAALQADVQKDSGSALKNELNATVKGLNAGISVELQKMKTTFDDQFKAAAANGQLNISALAGSATALFSDLIINGEKATDALKQTVKETVGSLLDVYVGPIIASYISFLGPFALPVALAAVQGLKALFNSAVAGFQDGGYTGNAGEGAVAGVVHGQEFVHTASVTRKNRALFEYLHKGGELSNWAVSAAGNLQQPVSIAAPMMNTYGIESRLDRLETAIVKSSKRFDSMRAVQMTVEHDPTLTIKAQSRNLQVRNARV
jgi:phage-related protein